MEVLQADGAVKYLLHYAESDLIIVITESMVIGQFAIEEDGGINEISRQSFLIKVISISHFLSWLRNYILGLLSSSVVSVVEFHSGAGKIQ